MTSKKPVVLKKKPQRPQRKPATTLTTLTLVAPKKQQILVKKKSPISPRLVSYTTRAHVPTLSAIEE